MNATEDGVEPLGEAPEMPAAPKFPDVQTITYYKAQCTSCGKADFYEWTSAEEAHSETIGREGWVRHIESGELLCTDCQVGRA